MKNNLIEVRELEKYFEVSGGLFSRNKSVVKAVDGISFDIPFGSSLGLVGQSGCGKTTTARALSLLDPKTNGIVNFYNEETSSMQSIDELEGEELKKFRRNIQMIFQDPYSSLNPRMIVKDIIREPLNINTNLTTSEKDEKVAWLLNKVGLSMEQSNRYPHEFSGGQRQRIGIARAIYHESDILIFDESTNALDLKSENKIIEEIKALKDSKTIIIISHKLTNLNICDKVYELKDRRLELKKIS